MKNNGFLTRLGVVALLLGISIAAVVFGVCMCNYIQPASAVGFAKVIVAAVLIGVTGKSFVETFGGPVETFNYIVTGEVE